MTSALFGEKSLSKVGAQFKNADEVHRAKEQLTGMAGIDGAHVRVVEPNDPAVGSQA